MRGCQEIIPEPMVRWVAKSPLSIVFNKSLKEDVHNTAIYRKGLKTRTETTRDLFDSLAFCFSDVTILHYVVALWEVVIVIVIYQSMTILQLYTVKPRIKKSQSNKMKNEKINNDQREHLVYKQHEIYSEHKCDWHVLLPLRMLFTA